MSQETNLNVQNSQDVSEGGGVNTPSLGIIREEQASQGTPSVRIDASKAHTATENNDSEVPKTCTCIKEELQEPVKIRAANADDIEALLQEKETQLRDEYDRILEKEMGLLKERFDYILANEQTRASYMLREAHRERQEKITALKSQLECKNLAALMYVMCTERRRSKLEKLRIIRDYTEYIHSLQDILCEGQELILHLSRGYKTAARVDHEWREKMKKVISQFMSFIYHFAGGNPDTNQYFLDLPRLLKTEAPIFDNPEEDPCENLEEEEESPAEETPVKKLWWQQFEDEKRPFVIFGDMADLKPCERREVLKTVKAKKTAPKKWKEYVFNDMTLGSKCVHLDYIKDQYPKKVGPGSRWECQSVMVPSNGDRDLRDLKSVSKQSLNPTSRRMTGQSIDMRGNMGSLLKIIAIANAPQTSTKTALLGARDSMEITSTTKLRERLSLKPPPPEPEEPKVVLAVGRRRTSLFEHAKAEIEEKVMSAESITLKEDDKEEMEDPSNLALGSVHHDSLTVIQTQPHIPDTDHKIIYERVCPMEKCKKLQVDSFMRSLPPYMRANPFTHFENTFEEYETCTPEQLEVLKERLKTKKAKELEDLVLGEESPTAEWIGRGVAVQTSDLSLSLPPCTCHGPRPSPVSSNYVFSFQDLLPVKQAMDAIHKECLYDDKVEFNRFKVIGQESKDKPDEESGIEDKEFKATRYLEIQKVLGQHPSLLELFQAST